VAEIPKKEADHPDDQRRPAQDKRDGAGGKNPQARGETNFQFSSEKIH
jgi:hypothetical protein